MPCDGQYKDALRRLIEQMDVIKRLVGKYPDQMFFATTAAGTLQAALFIRDTVKFFMSMSHIHTDGLIDKWAYYMSHNFDIITYSLSLISHNASSQLEYKD